MKKTIIKKGFASLLILALLMMYIPTASFAAEDLYQYVSNQAPGATVNMTTVNNVVPTIFNVHQTFGGSNKFLAYCIDLETVIKKGIDYRVAFLENVNYISNPGKVRNVIYSSYPNKSLEYLNAITDKTWGTLDESEAITATQAAIWHLTHDDEDLSNHSSGDIREFYTYLIQRPALPMPDVATINLVGPSISFVGSNVSIEFYYKTDGQNSDSTPVSLSLDSSEASEFAVSSSTGNSPYPDYTKVTMTKSIAEFDNLSEFKFTLNIEGTQTLEDVYVFEPVNGRKTSQTLVSKGFMNTNSVNREIEIDLTEESGSLTINKSYKYNNGTPYTGSEAVEATFNLLLGNDVVASGQTTDFTLTFNNLLPGTYTLVETSSGNYTSSLEIDGEDEVVIPLNNDETNSNVAKNVVNTLDTKEPGSIKVIKSYSEDSLETPEVTFKLSGDTDPQTTVELETIFLDLAPGTYTLEEIVPADFETEITSTDNVVVNDDGISANVTVIEGSQTEVNVKNTPKNQEEPTYPGSIKVIKSYSENSLETPEVTFKLSGDKEPQTTVGLETIFTNLTPGNYTLEEIVPNGFDVQILTSTNVLVGDDGTATVSVLEESQTVVNVLNTPKPTVPDPEEPDKFGSIKVLKSYSDSSLGTPEVIFNISNDDINLNQTTVGLETTFSNLEPGTYVFTEIVPDGFNVQVTTSANVVVVIDNSSAFNVTVFEDTQTLVEVENTPISTPDPDPTPDPEPNPDPDPTPDPEPTPDPNPTPDPDPTPDPEPIGPRGTVRVHYEDTEGNELASPFEFSSGVGSIYNTAARTFDGYELIETPSNASGTFIDGTIDVIYVYSDGEELEVEPEPTPLAPPVVPDEPEAIEDEMIEEEIIEEPIEEITLTEEIPLGSALPQTGQIPAEIFFGIGSIISLAGISLKKKK